MQVAPERQESVDQRELQPPFKQFIEVHRQGWITRRDVECLVLLYRFRFLPLSRLQAMKFPSKRGNTVANRRLLKMYRAGLVDRFKAWPRPGEGDTEYIYALDNAGAYFVAAALGVEVSELSWRKRDNEVKLAYVEHYLRASEVYLALEHQVEFYRFDIESNIKGKGYSFRADIYSEFSKDGYKHFWLVECDQGTEWYQQIARKVKNYESYYRANAARPGFVMPFVCFIARDIGRIMTLKNWIGQAKQLELPYRFMAYDRIKP